LSWAYRTNGCLTKIEVFQFADLDFVPQDKMIWQLLFALILSSLTVAFHALGTVYAVIPASGALRWRIAPPNGDRPAWKLIRLVSLLLVLHLVEVAIWAAAFSTVGVFSSFETSMYYSLKSYTTVGYGDVLPDNSWRLLGPIEAAVGILMLGWSTGIIVAAVQRIYGSRFNVVAGDDDSMAED
jgi:hypothetical protein